jgi:hypothetical protein
VQLNFSRDDLRPLIESVVVQVLERFGSSDGIAFSEAEAAALIGQRPHVLRDMRLKGRVSASRIGRGHFYTRNDILQLQRRRGAT